MYQAFFTGRCDAMTQDASALAGAVGTAAPNLLDYKVLPETISKEPSGPSLRRRRSMVRYRRLGAFWFRQAEEAGITAANADQAGKVRSNSMVQRLFGTTGDFGQRLGPGNRWMLNAIKAGGNYGEIFERNVGGASQLKLGRGLNGLWTHGGLMYAIPYG